MAAIKLTLYLTGKTPRSVRAEESLRKICDEEFTKGYDLEIIDVLQQPEAARDQKIMATPTLIKETPAPRRRVIGDLTSKELLSIGLDMAFGSTGAAGRELS